MSIEEEKSEHTWPCFIVFFNVTAYKLISSIAPPGALYVTMGPERSSGNPLIEPTSQWALVVRFRPKFKRKVKDSL